MNFDLNAMKIRARQLMKWAVPNVVAISFWFILLQTIGMIMFFVFFGRGIATVLSCICLIVINIVGVGYKKNMLSISREQTGAYRNLFFGFSKNIIQISFAFIVNLLGITIGYCLFFIPGIILFYRWRFVYYVLADEECTAIQAFKKSMELTKKHCMDIFMMDVSFIGWYLLNMFTLGLGGIYVNPYINITFAEYYDYLKGQKEFLN